MILMKYRKMSGLAAATALGLLAFVGPGTASATTLFTDEAKTIVYPTGTTLHLTHGPGTSWRNTSNGNTVGTCTESTIHGTTSNETGTWIVVPISSWIFGGCSQTTHTVSKGSLEIMWTSGTSGEVIGKGTSVTTSMFGTSCTYGTGTGTKLGSIIGGSEPVLTVNSAVSKIAGGFLCPGTVDWEGTFYLTVPHALYVGA
jgi:hypothetical protein